MTKDYDIVKEQKISTDNVVESVFVNVGWGSFETQFKGSEGKHATKLKVLKLLIYKYHILNFLARLFP